MRVFGKVPTFKQAPNDLWYRLATPETFWKKDDRISAYAAWCHSEIYLISFILLDVDARNIPFDS